MAKKDYVGHGRSIGTRCKKTKKLNSKSSLSKIMVVLAFSVLITFIGVLWFIIEYHKKEDVPIIRNDKITGNRLPPKPEERWRYIKELENRQIGVLTANVPTSGGGAESQTQLTNEQRQLLNQIKVDMRQQPMQLNEVPWREHTPAPRQQLQRQIQHATPSITVTRESVRQQKKYTVFQSKTENKTKNKKDSFQGWIVQCGSFKVPEQAESIRAQLAFEGFESRITTKSGLNRVVIGPYKNRSIADGTLRRLHGSGYANCIPLAVRS